MGYFDNTLECYMIAEIGVNHNGDMDLCRKMIDAAKKSGADAVKFQTYSTSSLVTKGTPKVEYQKNNSFPTESHYDMLKRLEFRKEDHEPIKKYCERVGVDFLSTPYDIDGAIFLDKLGVKMFKTASADLIDLPLQKWISSTGKPVIISTGMSSLGEVESVVNIYRKAKNDNFILLHTVSNYPCSDDSLNLRVMKTMKRAFKAPIGYSDHSIGNEAAILSLAFGSKVIEKHFTLDKNFSGPDHLASSTPGEFSELVQSVRRAEKMLGSPVKVCQNEESQMFKVSRKSIVLSQDLEMGEIITLDGLTMKRPGNGISALHIEDIVSRRTKRAMKKDTQIQWSDLA